MYPYLRYLKLVLDAKKRAPLDITEESVLPMRVWPGDVDMFMELNNGRHMTLMDLGRFDLAARSGFLKVTRERDWGFAAAGASIRFRYRIKFMERFNLRTRLIGLDSRWFYFEQRTEVKGKICSSALVRGAVVSRNGAVPIEESLSAIGRRGLELPLPDWVKRWAEADSLRPWPED
ncbi:MAG: hypothetical protein C0609_07400 [Deltaproteobacteria bacterium]|nr:MAG: hypothetical protein C0609_07400 [Deltaproteobacteria bacterium]